MFYHPQLFTKVLLAAILCLRCTVSQITDNDICPPNGVSKECDTTVHPDTTTEAICDDVNDAMCVEHEKHVDWLASAAVRFVTNFTNNATSTTISYDDPALYGITGPYVSDKCKDFETAYQTANPGSEINKGAYSPWIYMLNIDENRIPEIILETQCVCDNCLNPNWNGKHEHYVTKALKVTRYFHLKNNGTTVFNAQFSYGCLCELNA